MKVKTKASITRAIFTIVFAVTICLGCFLSVPTALGIPISAQSFFVIFAALIMGGLQGASSVGLFIIAGIAGVPVFIGATKGWDSFMGATGGFIWGYFIAAAAAGLIVGSPHNFEKKFNLKMWLKIALASLVGFILIYVPGILWYVKTMAEENSAVTFSNTVPLILTTLVPMDFIKFVITVPLAALLRPVAAKYLYPDDEQELKEIMEEMKGRKSIHDKVFNKKKK